MEILIFEVLMFRIVFISVFKFTKYKRIVSLDLQINSFYVFSGTVKKMNRNGFIMDPGYVQHPGLVYAPLPGPQENYVVVQAPQRTAPPGPVKTSRPGEKLCEESKA